MARRIPLWSDARQVVRPVSVCAVGLAVVGYATAVAGSQPVGFVLAGISLFVAGALVYQVHRAVGRLRAKWADARRAAAEAERHYVAVLRRIIRIVEARNEYSEGHSERVGRLAGRIARSLGLARERCEELSLAGELHDIGLLAIPDGILTRHTRFGVDEFRKVQRHPQVSHDILSPLESLAGVLPDIRHHHERMNGTGYPDGLAGEDIPLGARILAVADAYDAMTHDRPHRPAITPLEAVEELRRCTPAGYAPECVQALASVLHMAKPAHVLATAGV